MHAPLPSLLVNQSWIEIIAGWTTPRYSSLKEGNLSGVQLKMPSRAFEVDIKLEKVVKDTSANSPDQLAGRTCMVGSSDTNG